MLKKLDSIFSKYRSYPFIHTHKDFVVDQNPVRFHIKNPVERFRLQKWGWEKELIVDLLAALKPNDVLYDIGASVGALSIPSAQKANLGKVISFEPDPENVASLRGNFELNGITNYQIMECAVGDEEGELELFTAGSGGFSPSLRKVNGISTTVKVPIKTIDGLLAAKAIPPPTVVKIDIEGAEMICLKGMDKLLSSNDKPRLIIFEVHPDFLPAFNTNVTEVLRFVIEKGYQFQSLETRAGQILCKITA
ncbi:MAG: FkbM family methyltransferase [Saprospiraceae bacterium]|jgi:FkbM family methyltransferase|nr:FkbM family methyltransferase [Saprospiraceae bacterium]